MYRILQVREKFTSSSPSLAKSKTFAFNVTMGNQRLQLLPSKILKGATIVDQIVSITPVENYVPNHDPQFMQEVRNMDIAIHAVPS
ncbi:hypothetical protein OIU76_016557, partial [Salix suchowensis]